MWDYAKGEYVVDNPDVIGELPGDHLLLRDGDYIVVIDGCENVIGFGETVPDLLAAIDMRMGFDVMFLLSPDADSITMELSEV